METDGQKSDFRQRSSSRGARGGRGNFRGRGGSLERGRGKGGGFDGRGRGRGRGFGGRGGQRGQGRGGPRGRGRGGGSGERGQGRRGGFGSERSGRGFGGERRGRGFRGGRFLSQSSFRGGRTDFSGNDDGPLKNSGEKSNVQNNEMSNQRGGQGFVRGRGRGGRFSHSKDRQNEAQAEKTLENKSILVSKPRPEDVKRKYKLAPEETKKAVLLSNLPKKIESLHEEFKNFISSCIGPVKLITYRKVTTSKVAFVNAICIFEEASDFKLALENLHGQEFNGRHLLVQQFKNFKYDTHHTTKNCVCVTNMAEKIAEEDLWKLFEGCGTLGMIHINRNVSTGTPLEAIVNFKEPEGVTAALKLDGSEVLGSAVKVVQLDRSCSVLVANVNRQTTHQEFKELFSDCNIAYFTFAPKVKKELKSAFVYLADKEGHEQALSLNGVELKGCTLSVTSGTEKEAIPSYDIYLHLPPGAVPKEVTKAFSNFGEVLNVRIPFKKGISKVSFKEAKQAQAAASCSHVALNGDDVKVFASFGVALKDKKREKKKNNPVALSDKEVKQEKQKNSTLKKNSKNVKNFEVLEANSDEDSDTEDTSIIKKMKMDETDESDVSGEEENMTNEGRFVKALVKTSRKNNNVHPIHKEVEVSEEESDSGLSDEDLMADVQEDGQEFVLAHSSSVPKKSKSQGKRKRRDSGLSKNLKNSKKLKKKL